jgi:hypothetical protein
MSDKHNHLTACEPAKVRSVAVGGKFPWGTLIALFSTVLCFVGVSMSGRLGLVLSSLGTLGFGYVVALIGRRALPESITWVALISIYCSQVAFQVLIGALDIPPLGGAGFDIYANIGVLTLSQLCLLAGNLLAALALSAFSQSRRRSAALFRSKLSLRMQVYLVMALILVFLRMVVAMPVVLPETARYLSLVLTDKLEGACFFAGWFSADMGGVGIWCFALLIGNAITGGLLGSRYGIGVLGLYMVGRLASPRERYRRRVVVLCAVLIVPALLMFSAIGELRGIIGRGKVDLLNTSTFTMLVDSTVQAGSAGNSQGEFLWALSRLYAWPNAAVVELTPEEVPYRGYKESLSEWKFYINPNMGKDYEQYEDTLFQEGIGHYHGSDYGYTNVPGNTSEFGIVADGWSTGGALGVILLSFLVAFGICGAERGVTYIRISSAGALLFSCILCSISLLSYVNPAPVTLKAVLTASIAWLPIIKCLDAATNHLVGAKSERATTPI